MSVDEAVALVRARDAIGFGIITGTPVALLRALGERSDWEDLTFSGGLSLGSPEIFAHPNVHYRVSFYGGHERALAARGADVQHVPSFFRHYGLLIQHLKPRVMMAPVSMPDEDGRVSLSLHSGASLEELVRAGRDPERLLIVEASPHFPRTRALVGHENHLDLEDVDVIVYTDEQPTTFANDPGSPDDCGSPNSRRRTSRTARPCKPASGPCRTSSRECWPRVTVASTACTPRCSPTGCLN